MDKIKYKRSKRGNLIYKSPTLEKIWGHGICTIDAVNVTGAVARYCTKYCAKDSRCDDTFMLFSHGIGDKWLLDNFNGISYMLDGREYTIPRGIWQAKVMEYINENYEDDMYIYDNFRFSTHNYLKFGSYYMGSKEYALSFPYRENNQLSMLCSLALEYRYPCYKYRSLKFYLTKFDEITAHVMADMNAFKRKLYSLWRDEWSVYKNYLTYWQKKIEVLNKSKKSAFKRILALPDSKYFAYKQKALAVLTKRSQLLNNYSTCYDVENLELPPRYVAQTRKLRVEERFRRTFAHNPCHKCANDTIDPYVQHFIAKEVPKSWFVEPFVPIQLSFI